jgi:hypothetical protein
VVTLARLWISVLYLERRWKRDLRGCMLHSTYLEVKRSCDLSGKRRRLTSESDGFPAELISRMRSSSCSILVCLIRQVVRCAYFFLCKGIVVQRRINGLAPMIRAF